MGRIFMEVIAINQSIFALVGSDANAGFIRTRDGVVVIDTTYYPDELRDGLEKAGLATEDVIRVIFTHAHSDHINGYKLLGCPIVCNQRAEKALLKKYPQVAPSLVTFDDEHEMRIGGVLFRLIHTSGHSPDSIVAWLPEEKVLFAGDLIFSGTAPPIMKTSFKKLNEIYTWLPTLEAEVIVPGHGAICDNSEVRAQQNYVQGMVKFIEGQVRKGTSLDAIRKDEDLPHKPGKQHERNIDRVYKWMVEKVGEG
jgi:cyclase